MLGELTAEQTESLLRHQHVGRIGCHDGDTIFVVPITYAYDGAAIYGRSKEGLKITMMRKNPLVCFEVDVVADAKHWQSVVLWGAYEELTTESDRQRAMRLLADQSPPVAVEVVMPMMRQPEPHPAGALYKPVLFRINITRKTGRYERGQ